MEYNMTNLIKNVLEENAIKFKDEATELLYSKVANRLKNEYIKVSNNLFKNINETIAGEVMQNDEAESEQQDFSNTRIPNTPSTTGKKGKVIVSGGSTAKSVQSKNRVNKSKK